MNWDAISAIGEIIGAVAVVVSLIYLGIQIQQNTRQVSISIKAAELSVIEGNIDSANRIREFFLLNPELLDLYRTGWKSYHNLDTLSKAKFGLLLRNVFSQVEGAYIRQVSIGNSPERISGLEKVVDEIVLGIGVQEFLSQVKPDWRPEFAKFVEARLALQKKKIP